MARLIADELESVVAMLESRHPDVPRGRIRAMVQQEYARLAAHATITDHLIPLTLNRCRARLADGQSNPEQTDLEPISAGDAAVI